MVAIQKLMLAFTPPLTPDPSFAFWTLRVGILLLFLLVFSCSGGFPSSEPYLSFSFLFSLFLALFGFRSSLVFFVPLVSF